MFLIIFQIFFDLIAAAAGAIGFFFFLIGFSDDTELYIPGAIWSSLAVMMVAIQYLFSH